MPQPPQGTAVPAILLRLASELLPTRVRTLPILLLASLAASLPAQGLRLLDRIEAPMLYLSLGAAADSPTPAGTRPGNAAARPAGPVQQLLADPAFDALLGRSGGIGEGAAGRAFALVRGVLARSPGELELALTGVVPAGGQPLLVLRAQLQNGEAARLQGLLDEPSLAQSHRELGGRRTWSLRPAAGEAAPARAGELVELALVGDDLLVANDTTAMEELLAPAPRTAAPGQRLVLAADPRFTSLRARLQVPAGSLLVYGDWLRLSQRLQTSGEGVPSFLLAWSGLGSARTVMATVAGFGDDFTGTLLFDFDRPEAALAGRDGRRDRAGRRPGHDGQGRSPLPGERDHDDGPPDLIDGWFASALSVPARTLVPELPGAGLGGLVLAIDLADVANRSHGGRRMLHELRESFEELGLDFERNVMGRLGTRGTVQMLVREPSAGVPAEVVSVYAVRAKSRKAAGDLFTDLRRAAEQRGHGRLLAGKETKGPDVLQLDGARHFATTFVAVHEETVLLAFDVATLVQVHDEYKRAGKQRGRRDATVAAAVQRIGGDNVSGLFDLDLAPLLAHLASALSTSADGRSTASVDLSRIPSRHIGYLAMQPREGGVVLRVCVLSSQ
jgi:hypothetical protein